MLTYLIIKSIYFAKVQSLFCLEWESLPCNLVHSISNNGVFRAENPIF